MFGVWIVEGGEGAGGVIGFDTGEKCVEAVALALVRM